MSFEQSFWGDEDKGFEVLVARMKQGKHAAIEVFDIIKERAIMEEEVGKKISKMASRLTAKEEVGTLREAMDSMRNGFEQSAQAHLNLASEIRTQIEKPLGDLIKNQSEARKAQVKIVEKALKTKKAQIALVGKTKKNYEVKTKEADAANDAASKATKDADKFNAKAKKATAAAEQADAEYQRSIDKLKEVTQEWENLHRTACGIFQKVEEERIENLKNFLWQLMNLLSTACVANDETYRTIHEIIQKIDIQNDVSLFINERTTGKMPPAVLEYEPIRGGSGGGGFGAGTPQLTSGISAASLNTPDEDAPKKFTPPISQPSSSNALFYVKVMYDYEPQGEEELALTEGEVVPVISDAEDPWWEGEKNGRTGMFPSNFVSRLPS